MTPPPQNSISEAGTVTRVLSMHSAGEKSSAIQVLHSLYGERLKQQIMVRLDRRLAGRVDPDDVLQEAFVDIMARLGNFQPERNVPLFQWLRMIVQERIIATHRRHLLTGKRDARREQGWRGDGASDESAHSLADLILVDDTSPSGRVLREERLSRLAAALEEITLTDREIILMRVYENLSNDDTAEALGIEPEAAKKRLTRAIRRLGELLRAAPEFASESGRFP